VFQLFPALNESSRYLCTVLDRYVNAKEDIPLEEVMGCFALDVVARGGFSQDLNTYSGLFGSGEKRELNPFTENVKEIFSNSFFGWRSVLVGELACSSLSLQ